MTSMIWNQISPHPQCELGLFLRTLLVHSSIDILSPQVEVDVYRKVVGSVRTEPHPGYTSFFSEAHTHWRETNSSNHFLVAAAAVQPLSMTMVQVLHHRDTVSQHFGPVRSAIWWLET